MMLGMLVSTFLAVALFYGIPILIGGRIFGAIQSQVDDPGNHLSRKDRATHRDSQILAGFGMVLGLCFYLWGIYEDNATIQQYAIYAGAGFGLVGLLTTFLFWLQQEIRRLLGRSRES